jgi:hypothetical protein
MLVITSDLHLTDGTSGTTIKADAFDIFKWRLGDLAYAASCRMLGPVTEEFQPAETYKPVDEVYMLLLGDVLDTIRSTRWLEGTVRPWDGPQHPDFAPKLKEITAAILDHNKELLQILRDFKAHGVNIYGAVNGRPDKHIEHNVKVKIYYLSGNHDWGYHVAGPEFDTIRAMIIDAMGLANDSAAVFPYDTQESPVIADICRRHHVFGRHGDIFDSNNYEGSTRDHSSLGDAVVIELVDRFAYLVEKRLGERAPKDLREIDNVRPFELVPTWIDGLLRRTDRDTAREVRKIWNEVADDFLKLPFVRQHHSSIKWGLRLTEGMSFSSLGKIVPWGKNVLTSLAAVSPALNGLLCKFGASSEVYPCALKEPAFADPEISYIVYGHTHRQEIVPLRTSTNAAGKPKSAYLNSGTWRAVFDLAQARPKDAEFFEYHVMTYLSFFKDDERRDREFETWSGSFESPMMVQSRGGTANMRGAVPDSR